jgi:hypothetical protein
VWFGVGVYTVCEILFLAGKVFFSLFEILLSVCVSIGVSPFLTELEVFTNPSRTARICEAFWSYKHKSAQCLRCVFSLFPLSPA